MKLVWATVSSISRESSTVQRLAVDLDDDRQGEAVSYPALSGRCEPGDRVLLNTTAVDLGLGTGGVHYVVARAGSADGVALDEPSGGHVMKARYTPLQVDVLSVEAPESPHHATMRDALSVAGMPVVCCGLHSQMPLVAAAVKRNLPSSRVAYCMSDSGALPLALSDLAAAALDSGLIDVTISCGQAFGGMLEAVSLHSGLLAARHVARADVAIVAIGPGIAGTATPFGHGGVAQGEAINAVSAVGGLPVACLRVSFADGRERHQGVSHHSIAALVDIALAPAAVALPGLSAGLMEVLEAQLERAGVWARHRRAHSEEGRLEPPSLRGVEVTTMGRGPAEDPSFFSAGYAAGDVASRLASGELEADFSR